MKRELIILIAAVLLGIAAMLFNEMYIAGIKKGLDEQISNKEEITVVARNLPARAIVTNDSVEKEAVPKKYIHPNAVLWKNKGVVIGKRIKFSLKKGQPLLHSDMLDQSRRTIGDSILPQHGLVVVPVDLIGGAGGLISPGSRVDVIGIFDTKYVNDEKAEQEARKKIVGKLNPNDVKDLGKMLNRANKLAEDAAKNQKSQTRNFVVVPVARNIGVFSVGTRTQMDSASGKRASYNNVGFSTDFDTRTALIIASHIVEEGGGKLICVLRSNEGVTGDEEQHPVSSTDFFKLINKQSKQD